MAVFWNGPRTFVVIISRMFILRLYDGKLVSGTTGFKQVKINEYLDLWSYYFPGSSGILEGSRIPHMTQMFQNQKVICFTFSHIQKLVLCVHGNTATIICKSLQIKLSVVYRGWKMLHTVQRTINPSTPMTRDIKREGWKRGQCLPLFSLHASIIDVSKV